jgi:putative glutamine amidotransferase
MAPLIGISCRINRDFPNVPPLHGVRASYLESIVAAGGVPIIIPLFERDDALRSLYSLCSGLLLPGGEDVDPVHYGEAPHEKLGEVCAERDRVELQLTRWAKEERKPILGICRGCQLLNVAFGGTLFQDIDAQREGAAPHGTSAFEGLHHNLRIDAGSRLGAMLGLESIPVNSLHHQAIKAPGLGLRPCGYSDDNLIEAVEGMGSEFVFGIQCHPESLWQKVEPRWKKIFIALVRAADEYAASICSK